MRAIEKKLKRDPVFNPFNDSFDYNLVVKEVEKCRNSIEGLDARIINTALSTGLFNKYYRGYYDFFKDTILKLKAMQRTALTSFFFAAANKDYCAINAELRRMMQGKKEFSFEDLARWKIKSPAKELGQIDPYGLIDISVDILNVMLNFVRYYEASGGDVGSEHEIEEEIEPVVRSLYRATNLFRVVKDAYDSVIWEGGYVVFEGEENDVYVRYSDEVYPIVHQVGLLRLQNVFAAYIGIKEEMDIAKSIIDRYSSEKRIKSVYREGNRILWHMAKGKDKALIDELAEFHAGMLAYYPFIIETKLPAASNLSILEISVLFAHLKVLVRKIFEFSSEKGYDPNSVNLATFVYALHIQDVSQYLRAQTSFQKAQIKAFLGLLEHHDGRYDLWKRPLIKQHECYLFPFVCILAPNVIHLIDEWLEAGGYSLDKRGPLFESYVKATIAEELTRKEFFYGIADQKTFVDSEGHSEEIDLVLNLKNAVLVGELKCIKHAMESRQDHDSLLKLNEGAEQVMRKMEFLRKNRNCLRASVGDIEGKDMIPVVLANLPIFSGMRFHNVPIVDFSVLDSYISSGRLVRAKIVPTKSTPETQEMFATEYYKDEDEFSLNLRRYLDHPLPIEELSCGFELEDFRITPDHVKPKIFLQIASTANELKEN